MALTDESNGGSGMVMPVQPMGYGNGGNYGMPYAMPYAMPVAYGYGNGGFGDGFGGDGAWLILFLILAMGGYGGFGMGGFGGFGGWGGLGNDITFPWLLNGQQGINANTNAGFNQAAVTSAIGDLSNAVTSGFGDVQLGIAGVNQNICQTGAGIQNSLCNGFAGVNQAMQNGFAQAEISDNARQMANMQQAFNSQTAIAGAINGVSNQAAEIGYQNSLATANLGAQIAREACADRETVNLGIRDLLANSTSNTQSVLNTINDGIRSINDKLCQQELDAERRENQNLRSELMYARGQASQVDQTAQLLANNNAQTALFQQGLNNEVDALYNRLKNCPVPTQPVYGNQPIFTCQPQNACGCGCNGSFN